jgi:hypothetical protein
MRAWINLIMARHALLCPTRMRRGPGRAPFDRSCACCLSIDHRQQPLVLSAGLHESRNLS